jgi:hypothetical protein
MEADAPHRMLLVEAIKDMETLDHICIINKDEEPQLSHSADTIKVEEPQLSLTCHMDEELPLVPTIIKEVISINKK